MDEEGQDNATKATDTKPNTETVGEENESGDNIDDEYYEVQEILGEHRSKVDGKLYYKIRWKGYSPEHDSLEPAGEIAHCVEIIAEWERKKAGRAKRQGI